MASKRDRFKLDKPSETKMKDYKCQSIYNKYAWIETTMKYTHVRYQDRKSVV